jgi:hypothetical protein
MAEKEPLGGEKDLALKIAAGIDPNADIDVDKDTKAQAALGLATAGASWSDIARVLEYASPALARTAVERALASASNSPEKVEHQRILQDKRLKRLLQSVYGKAVNPEDKDHLAYNARALAIIDRIGKLHGLDVAQQTTVTATDETIAALVGALAKAAGLQNQAIEAEILEEAEIVEGDIG